MTGKMKTEALFRQDTKPQGVPGRHRETDQFGDPPLRTTSRKRAKLALFAVIVVASKLREILSAISAV